MLRLWTSLYPTASPLAIDLLSKMIVFNPDLRITVDLALAHPYLASLNATFKADKVHQLPFTGVCTLARAHTVPHNMHALCDRAGAELGCVLVSFFHASVSIFFIFVLRPPLPSHTPMLAVLVSAIVIFVVWFMSGSSPTWLFAGRL